MELLTLAAGGTVAGTLSMPGSKSLSNRALLLSAFCAAPTALSNVLDADDIRHMRGAFKALGVAVAEQGESLVVQGPWQPGTPAEPIFLGNAGTAMRPLTAALALTPGTFELVGEPRMYERPIGDLVDALRQLGADIRYLGEEGYPPLKINGKKLAGGTLSVKGDLSSQFLSALLMAAPLCEGDVTIKVDGELVSKPYVELTLGLMAIFGVTAERPDDQTFVIKGACQYQSPGNYYVEGDASSASYFAAAGAIGGDVTIKGLFKGMLQGDVDFVDALEQMGAKVQWGEHQVRVQKGELKGIDIDANAIPDAAMTLATTALFAEGQTVIRNIYNWRLKETDRLHAMATELKKVGAEVEEGQDFIKVSRGKAIRYAEIDTYNDHRMAMCFALLALGNSTMGIRDPKCTAKTFPDFFARFAAIRKGI
ncbi:3-phosphoshikimate 1-carboxyvinyltransferase [Gallaecimonas pentaromativorans]|uniref:3-phosphoshikimate 1-carboxyvinyltransferase n=1 Tax=Gallaecimonas pentaromativorans TaxID=584787 RepID=UPI00067F3B7A|nr:3-phosphoshikimate 1-carboxyvinyltransferase [Gallaecimonas pentaromativorans]MED5525539.1 3-phosphoshikimate 1-carboxyvinyltransferase [Pseudomonadota bacterium]